MLRTLSRPFSSSCAQAGTLRHPEALAAWLHGVAVRLAGKARAAAARRLDADSVSAAPEPCDPHPDALDVLSARELLSLIDREIASLPEVYRLPLLLCDVEGRTQPEAARLLGWTPGSLRGRLLRGRTKLRKRLLRHGVAPETLTVLLAAGLTQANADAVVPLASAASVSRLATLFSTCPTSPAIPMAAAEMAKAGLRGMMLVKLKLLSVVLLTTGMLTAGAGLLARNVLVPQGAEERTESKPPSILKTEERTESKPPSPPAAAPPQRANDKSRIRLDQAGDPLPDGAVARLGTIRFRHGGLIENLAFAADGKTLVSCGAFDGMRFWDAATGKEIQRFPEQTRAHSIALSPDGKLLAVTVRRENPKDEPIAIRDFASGRLLRRFGHPQTPAKLLFSPNGKVLAAFEWDKVIELWDPSTGHHLHTLKGHTDRVWSVAFFADSKTLISGSDDRTMRFWDLATGKQLRQIQHDQRVGKIALSSDGKLLASIDLHLEEDEGGGAWLPDRHVRLWDAGNGKELRQLAMPAKELAPKMPSGFSSLRFAPDGKTLLTGGDDGTLRIWDPVTGRENRRFSGFTISPGIMQFAPDGKRLAVEDGASTIRLIRLADGKDLVTCQGHHSGVSSVLVTPNCQTVVTSSRDGTLRFWNPATGRESHRRSVDADAYNPLKFLLDGQTYLTAGSKQTLYLHDLVTGEKLAALHGHQSPYPFALSPDRKTLASLNADKTVRLLDPANGTVRHRLMKVEHDVYGMSFTTDSRNLVTWDANRIVTVWGAASGKKQRQFHVSYEGPSLYTAELSPDGRLLALGLQVPDGKQGILPVLETATGKEIARFITGKDGAQTLTFSPDGKSLAWGGWFQGTIYIGEIATGGERRHFVGHRGMVDALAFSPDGKTLISGSNDTTALVWDLTGRLASDGKNDRRLSAEDLKQLWDALAAEDSAAGYRAIQALSADPEHSIAYLRPRLHPVAIADEDRLKRWIADLDSEQFAVREKAAAELEKLGEAALPAMRKVIENQPTLETRKRLEQLIEKQKREEWSPSSERRRLWRSLEVLERVGTAEARRLLTTLANGAPGAWLTWDAKAALERLTKRPPDAR